MERLAGIFSRGNQPAKSSPNPPTEQQKQTKAGSETAKSQSSHSNKTESKDPAKSDAAPPQTQTPAVAPVVTVPAIAAALLIMPEKSAEVITAQDTKTLAKPSAAAAVSSLPDKSSAISPSDVLSTDALASEKKAGPVNLTQIESPTAAQATTGNRMDKEIKTPGTSDKSTGEASVLKAVLPERTDEVAAKANSDSSLKNDSQPLKSQSFDAGMTVAKQDITMKMATKKTNFTGSEQKLPGAATASAGENLPTLGPAIAASTPEKNVVGPVATPDMGLSTGTATITINAKESVSVPQNSIYSAQLIQRTQELASLQVMRMQETGSDEMRVVIKPDTGVQLSLHLQQCGGTVEIQASSDRASYDLLNRHWPELQQQLAARGVRMAPLENTEKSFGGGSEGFRQPTTSHGQHPGDNVDQAETPAVFTSGLPTATATASASGISTIRISTSHLETWA